MKDRQSWRELAVDYPDIFDSLWLFPRRGTGGDKTFHGGLIPQIYRNLILRYTNEGDIVWDPMAGGGTAIDVGVALNRKVLASDIYPVREDVVRADANDVWLIGPPNSLPEILDNKDWDGLGRVAKSSVDLIILHPPYFNIIKFSEEKEDLSNCPTFPIFLHDLQQVGYQLDIFLKHKGWLALVLGDIYLDSQYIPLSSLGMNIWRSLISGYQLKALYVKDIRGNRDHTQNLWKSRHNKNGTSFFTHENIFLFRKD